MSRKTVGVVEDEDETRARLAHVIESEPRLSLVGVAGSCAEARVLVARRAPDLLLVDLGLPDGHGAELIRHVRDTQPGCEILVITVFGDERSVLAALEAGASGYVLKDATSDEIARALLQLAEGGAPISPAIARHLLRRFRAPDPSGATLRLSERESEVLRLLSKGFRYQEIGRILEVSPSTVTTYVRRLYRKLEVSSRSAAVWEARHLGLLGNDE